MKIIKDLIIIVLISMLIIPILSIKNSIEINTKYASVNNFIGEFLLFDTLEKLEHGILKENSSLKWNTKFFKNFEGSTEFNYLGNGLSEVLITVKWPKYKSNKLEFSSLKLKTTIKTGKEWDILYENR